MKAMELNEQLETVAGITCPLCGYSTWNILAYSAHGYGHLFEAIANGTI